MLLAQDGKTEPTNDSLSKWLALAGFGGALLSIAILLRTPTASGYEISIYGAFPWYFWALIIVSLILGLTSIVSGVLRGSPAFSNWGPGFVLSLVVGAVLLFMPYIRGYPIYGRSDVLTHLGSIQTIHATGGDPFQNIYQNIHQLVLALSYTTGLEPIRIINSVAGIIGIFSIFAFFALAANVFDRRRAVLTIPFVVPLFGTAHMNPSPFAQSALLFPFVLLAFVKHQQSEQVSVRFPLTVAVIAIILYHPLTAVFLAIVFVIHYGVTLITKQADNRATGISDFASKNAVQLSVVIFIAWYYNFAGIILRFETVAQRLLDPGSSETAIDTYGSVVAEYSPSLIDLAEVGLVKWGQTALFLCIGVVFVASLGWALLRGRGITTPYLLTFALGFIAFSALGVVFLTADMIGGFGRPLLFAYFFAALGASTVLVYGYDTVDRPSGVLVSVSILLTALVVLSVVGIYHSPMSASFNRQVTNQELDGAQWYFDSNLDADPLQEHGIRMYRFEHVLNGSESNNVPREGLAPPARFNYTMHETFGESYDRSQYYVLTERARTFYPSTYPDYREFWRFRPADFDRLEEDPTVSNVYSNGVFDVYLVESTDTNQ